VTLSKWKKGRTLWRDEIREEGEHGTAKGSKEKRILSMVLKKVLCISGAKRNKSHRREIKKNTLNLKKREKEIPKSEQCSHRQEGGRKASIGQEEKKKKVTMPLS